jgi:hypothetical protein
MADNAVAPIRSATAPITQTSRFILPRIFNAMLLATPLPGKQIPSRWLNIGEIY